MLDNARASSIPITNHLKLKAIGGKALAKGFEKQDKLQMYQDFAIALLAYPRFCCSSRITLAAIGYFLLLQYNSLAFLGHRLHRRTGGPSHFEVFSPHSWEKAMSTSYLDRNMSTSVTKPTYATSLSNLSALIPNSYHSRFMRNYEGKEPNTAQIILVQSGRLRGMGQIKAPRYNLQFLNITCSFGISPLFPTNTFQGPQWGGGKE